MLRRFEPTDIEEVLSVVHDTIDISYASAYSRAAVDFFIRYHDRASVLRDAESGLCLVIEEGGRLVATGTLVGEEVKRVFVLPSMQGRGLGRTIMAALMQEAKRSGLSEVRLHSSTVSKRFYELLGFSLIEDGSIDVGGGARLDYHLMSRTL